MDAIDVAFVLFPKVTQLDLTGPVQVLSRLGNVRIHLVSSSMDPVMTDAGFSINPTCTYSECPQPNVVCVPGGAGADDAMLDAVLIDWLRRSAPAADWITSVCTGSLVLGAAGLLKGKRATSHWLSRDLLTQFDAIPVAQRVVFDGRVVTGGGVTAGIDFALTLTAKIRGEEHAKLVQLALEYDPQPPFCSGSPTGADVETVRRIRELTQKAQSERSAKVAAAAATLHPKAGWRLPTQ
ncbi:DJ-1/PfpI family protein [Qipengyuania sp.]|uniref:DJ-1/PfpI family protein n=1 Tax=Qipengyuania sp. TaxID=2004515 RepID=UPI003BAB422B